MFFFLFKFLSSTIIICFADINFYLIVLISLVVFKRIVDILTLLSDFNGLNIFHINFPNFQLFNRQLFFIMRIIISNLKEFFFKTYPVRSDIAAEKNRIKPKRTR